MRKALVVCFVLTACSSPNIVESGWTEHETMGVARSEHPAAVFAGEITVVGGLVESPSNGFGVTASVEAYDPIDDSWRPLADLPAPRHHMMASVVDGRLFAIGGFSEAGRGDVVTVWEMVDREWQDRASLPIPIGAGAAVTLDGYIYVVGGAPGGGLYRYEPDADHWLELATLSQQREHLAAVAFDGEIWALAGRWQAEIFDTTEVYDPQTDTWREGPPLAEPRSGFGATVADEEILVAGGEVFDPDEALSSVERLVDEAWAPGKPLPFGIHGVPLVTHESRVYVPGGSTRAADVQNPGTMLSQPVGAGG